MPTLFKSIVLLSSLALLFVTIPHSYGISPSCMSVYDEGGAPAVFKSPECPDWVNPNKFLQNMTQSCDVATTQGRRRYQEDRISCNLDMMIPFLAKNGTVEEVRVGVVAVFDGHIGSEASDMASKLFQDYFFLHSVFGIHRNLSKGSETRKPVRRGYPGIVPEVSDEEKDILKEALVRTIHDIDVVFSKEARKNYLAAGSTAVAALLVDGQILVANVGDSKALLCSLKFRPHRDVKGYVTPYFTNQELTRDHTANIIEERERIEDAGGYILEGDVPLINGHFPMTRAIGDNPLKGNGIIAVPEVPEWQRLRASELYLVVASDGIFESFTTDNVCSLLSDLYNISPEESSNRNLHSCVDLSSAECIVQKAFQKGSTDNLSAVVVALDLSGFNFEELPRIYDWAPEWGFDYGYSRISFRIGTFA